MRGLLEQTANANEFRNAIYYHYYDFPAFHMVKKHYGVRTSSYKLMHFYDDIDEWELYDLEKDPQEKINIYNSEEYAQVRQQMHRSLDSLQQLYGVTAKEFQTTPKERVEQAYRNFAKLAGENPAHFPE